MMMIVRNPKETEMTPSLITIIASEHIADLQRDADRRRHADVSAAETQVRPIELRLAETGYDTDAHRLAVLDEAEELEGAALIAYADGKPVAALSLSDGRVVADPFAATSDAVALLRLRAEHLSGKRAHRPLRSLLHPRLAA